MRFFVDYEVYVDPAAAHVDHESRLLEHIIQELQAALRRVPAVQASADAVKYAADRASRLVTVVCTPPSRRLACHGVASPALAPPTSKGSRGTWQAIMERVLGTPLTHDSVGCKI